jgi:lipopolysaccharide export system permease protein
LIINRYLLREVWYALLAAFVVLLLIIASQRFVAFLGDVASGVLPVDVLFTLLGFTLLNYLPLLLSVAFYLGLLIAISRWYKDNEMTALASCGIGIEQLLRPVAVLALVFALLVALFSFFVSPWAAAQGYQLRERAERIADLSAIAAGRFVESNEGDWVFYAESFAEAERVLSNVFIQTRRAGELDTFSAQRAFIERDEPTGDRVLVMYEGYRYQGWPGRADYRILKYAKQTVRLRQPAEAVKTKREMSTTSKLAGSDHLEDIAELQWRLAMPLSIPLLALLAFVLSPTVPGRGRTLHVFSALLAYVIYNNVLGVGRSWLERGDIPVGLGLWWVHGAMLSVIALLWLQRKSIRRFLAPLRWALRR